MHILWVQEKLGCVLQSRQLGHSYLDSKAARLHVDLYTGPQAKPADLQICQRPDGSLWLLGEGACGKVYKVNFWRVSRTFSPELIGSQEERLHEKNNKNMAWPQSCHGFCQLSAVL